MSKDRFFVFDEQEETQTRFVSFMGEYHRYDLAITSTNRFQGKKIVMDLQGSHYAILGHDNVEESGYLEHVFNLSEVETEELREFLKEVI